MNDEEFLTYKNEAWKAYRSANGTFSGKCVYASKTHNPRIMMATAFGVMCRRCAKRNFMRFLGDTPEELSLKLATINTDYVCKDCDHVALSCTCEPISSDSPSSK